MSTIKLQSAIDNARQFFCPNGWGGYARFHSPHLPDKIGSMLLHSLQGFIHHNRPVRIAYSDLVIAITILSTEHQKNEHDPNGRPTGKRLTCYPTKDAAKAASLLEVIAASL